MKPRVTVAIVFAAGLLLVAGCIGSDEPLDPAADEGADEVDYQPPERSPDIDLEEFTELIEMPVGEDVQIHVRVVKPAGVDEAPVIAEFTPYNAPGRAMLIEPMVGPPSGTYVQEFVERGFAFAFADVRGTNDSSGCLDLRGSMDIADADALTEWLGTQEWSNGNVGFIGASYPGSEAHIAAIADNEHLGGVIPVVASTSFYHYHHKGGVPYQGQLVTNAGYNAFAGAPSANPQYENWLTKEASQKSQCDQASQIVKGVDTSGTYDAWWADRNLNPRTGQVNVPVLMAQGMQDWNVKPDHIDPYFNELDTNKTLVAPQMPHSFPEEAEDAYGDWWELATAFFDETLNGADTGMFEDDLAYIEDDSGTWHSYEDAWPPLEAPSKTVNVTENGLSFTQAPAGTVSWEAPPAGQAEVSMGEPQVVLESEPLDEALHISGTPTLNLTVVTEQEDVHLVAIVETGSGDDWERNNYGYLNPTYRAGVDQPQRVIPGEPTPVTIEMYPQEDIFEQGDSIRLTLSSTDDGSTAELYDPGEIQVLLDGDRPAKLELPLSPLSHGDA